MDDIRVLLDKWNKCGSEFRVLARKLNGKGGEDELEIAPILVVSRTEEGSPEPSFCSGPLRNRLGDGSLPGSSEPVQPVDRRSVEVARPEFDLVQNGTAGSLETTFAFAVPILSLMCIMNVVEDGPFSCERNRIRKPSLKAWERKML